MSEVLQGDVLQNILLVPQVVSDESLYFRAQGDYVCEAEGLRLGQGAQVNFFTWFGLFNLDAWRNHTTYEHFILQGEARGELVVEIWHHTGPVSAYCLMRRHVKSEDGTTFDLHIPDEIFSGLLSVRVRSLKPSVLYALSWKGVSQTPARAVRLGLSITTFNRQQAARASAERISAFIQQVAPLLPDDAELALAVVDNGRNLELPPLPHVTYIPNRNLGGSGGFARGLYHFKEERRFTHCLFMDDDAACETESIWRTLQLLRHAREADLAVAGTLFAQQPPYLQKERGARFENHCVSLGKNRDLRAARQLFNNEKPQSFDYGGWWFFAFPLEHVAYPFPFFVRGDDVLFGRYNRFTKITLAGVSTWGDDFSAKESPMTRYLDMRHHLMQYLLDSKDRQPWWRWARVILPPVLRATLTMRYATAEAQLLGVRHVLQGPAFWKENPALECVWPTIRALNAQEAARPVASGQVLVPPSGFSSNRKVLRRRLMKLLTLNGHLLPSSMWKETPVTIEKGSHILEQFMPYRCVFLVSPHIKGAVRLCKDRMRLLAILWQAVRLTGRMTLAAPALRRAYAAQAPALMHEAFWREQFSKEDA
ncbi:Glycosyltransferase, GT2 family [Sulfurivirga caldicuralii]|uniref:Glycosyltransferase, GT2 family n=1 Tax=Sulfurivirga caldicuralii TaxID=364032 RepID=A0A1N6H5R4_9GAMM|nr:glycosyltransferase [Sulfurivirga caldicuralii]SIO15099.1 Glycosyltransferase, GT2 family [Sulfurivirga caldicuralii]